MTTGETPRARFGVGQVISETLRVFARRFGLIFLLAFVPMVGLVAIIAGVALSTSTTSGIESTSATIIRVLVVMSALLVTWCLAASLIILAAFDTELGRPIRLGDYVRRSLVSLVPAVALSVVIGAILSLVFVVFSIVPLGSLQLLTLIPVVVIALYVLTMFSVFIPAIVIEGAGLRALGRSLKLTRGYRWPVLANVTLLFVVSSALNLGANWATRQLAPHGPLVALLPNAVLGSISMGLIGVGVAMIYARLRDLKEGVSVNELSRVFD